MVVFTNSCIRFSTGMYLDCLEARLEFQRHWRNLNGELLRPGISICERSEVWVEHFYVVTLLACCMHLSVYCSICPVNIFVHCQIAQAYSTASQSLLALIMPYKRKPVRQKSWSRIRANTWSMHDTPSLSVVPTGICSSHSASSIAAIHTLNPTNGYLTAPSCHETFVTFVSY
jgi:hypothetical protein